ncbi:hypothetical protein [Hydrogenimonas sp.]
MQRSTLLSCALAATLLVGCGSGTSDNYSESEAPGGYVLFQVDAGDIPYPNDILTNPVTGKLALPTSPGDSDYAVKSALNTLDGFSTTSPITVGVSADVDDASLTQHLLFIDTVAGPLTYGSDYALTDNGEKIAIVPLKPLQPERRYIVVLTKGLVAANGKPIEPDFATTLILGQTPLVDGQGHSTVSALTDEQAQKLEAIRQHTQQLIAAVGLPHEQILDIWSFKTQSIGKVAAAIADHNESAAQLQLRNTGYTSKQMLAAAGYDTTALKGNATVYAGILANLPYYLGVPSTQNPFAPLTTPFDVNESTSMPQERARLAIPVLATVPNDASGCGTMPADGWPVVIFQHGITQNRTNLLAISEAFATVCYAAVAIDLPLHGITDPNNPLYMEENATLHLSERTFDLDLDLNGEIDPSGSYYINLRNLLVSRDNLRQSTSDFIALQNALRAPAVSADGLKFDPAHVGYVGHSLGAMAPFGFFAHRQLESVVLANPGGGIAQLLNHSPRFGPVIEEGLAQAGVVKGTPEYDAFMLAVQTVIDDGDPINYAQAAAANQKMLSFETIGDMVIPNSIATAPLSGTEPLLRTMGAVGVDPADANASGFIVLLPNTNSVTRFAYGTHSSILDPGDTPEVTVEMQTEAASFVKSRGVGVQTTPYAPSVIEAP